MRKTSNNKEISKLIREAQRQKWVIVKTKSNHIKWKSPLGGMVFSSCTPSDPHALRNIVDDLKKKGFVQR
jgi:hypothetical protein